MKNWVLLSTLVLFTGAPAFAQPGKTKKVSFAKDIQPILSANCFACHGPDLKKSGLRLDSAEGAFAKLRGGIHAIVPGKVKDSELLVRVFSDEPSERMPPPKGGKELKPYEKELLKRWIEEGAEYQVHWAFQVPKEPKIPLPKDPLKARSPIDWFIGAKLAAEGLTPAPEADRPTLARRVALDLTGLPPTPEMVARFLKDTRPDAYEKYVEEVLKSPAYGERWAHVWLDLARYADSNGYAEDQPRTIWKYRDWVIDAINKNLPFDQFTIEQLAGDLLPSPTPDQLIATGFHRNTLTNTEGGTNDEEYRNIAIVDRVNTTFAVWMGLTVSCAQCHNHKYDPISQEEYYNAFAIFNQTEDSDQRDNTPNYMSLSSEDAKRKAELDGQLAGLNKELAKRAPDLDARQTKWEKEIEKAKQPKNIQAILNLAPAKRNPAQKNEISSFFRGTIADIKDLNAQIVKTKAAADAIKPVPTPVMKELPAGKKRVTKIHIRGDWLNLGKEVSPGIPSMFHGLPKGMPADRLALAKWIVDPANPLTSRVAVNRYWEQIMGAGLVNTPEDFGLRSELPLHPELLDWLAIEFQRNLKWDVKKLLTLIVTSATYRQDSKVTPALYERDPENRLFARGPRFRSSAETIRDQSLFVAGLLSPTMGGPSVRPPQPKFGLSAAFGPGTDWTNDTGDNKHRRGLYTYWRRTTPYPSMVTFDAPARTVCTIARPRTNTPLQALVTLNDPCFVEAAQGLARRMMKDGGATVRAKAAHGFRLCLVRDPHEKELTRLVSLYEATHAELAKNAKDAAKLATDPLGPLPAGMDALDAAAWTVVGNVLLNLDEFLVKR